MVSNEKQKYKVWRGGDEPVGPAIIETHSATMAAERFADRDRSRVKDYENNARVRIHVITPDDEELLFDVTRVTYMSADEFEGPDE